MYLKIYFDELESPRDCFFALRDNNEQEIPVNWNGEEKGMQNIELFAKKPAQIVNALQIIKPYLK